MIATKGFALPSPRSGRSTAAWKINTFYYAIASECCSSDVENIVLTLFFTDIYSVFVVLFLHDLLFFIIVPHEKRLLLVLALNTCDSILSFCITSLRALPWYRSGVMMVDYVLGIEQLRMLSGEKYIQKHIFMFLFYSCLFISVKKSISSICILNKSWYENGH